MNIDILCKNIPGNLKIEEKCVIIKEAVRKGIHSIWWNPFMVDGAEFNEKDIPYCSTTAATVPNKIITYEEARQIHRRELSKGNKDYYFNAFVCFYLDDYKFDGINGIWFRSKNAYRVLSHFTGIITPDFSICQDFPYPLKIWNTYRMRAFGYWYGVICIKQVIHNVRWGTSETYAYCFDCIPTNSIVCIGTIASGLKYLKNRPVFEAGLFEMVRVLKPHTIIVYGSANYECFDILRKQGINIISYPSKTSQAFKGGLV